MHIHILGICGTFMAGVAILAKQLGYRVTGSDMHVYPPMSTQLEDQGIEVMQGYTEEHLNPEPDCVVIGNALSRGNQAVEYVLNQGLNYTSGPQWLADHLLKDRWVLAVAGTHGKTTTASMLAWILEDNDYNPGFLIGGIPTNFELSARLGKEPFFVVEADEYDTAFFDKRSKFVHYHSRTLILNNLEYDHADIFRDLEEIQRQFHHLVRTVPQNGLIISPKRDRHLQQVLEMGCWTPIELIDDDEAWQAELLTVQADRFDVKYKHNYTGQVSWSLIGSHNVNNALAAIAAARHVGVEPALACQSLCSFSGVKRRLEIFGIVNNITLYDDFAHHPTAIAATIAGLRHKLGASRLIVVLEPRSNTMRMGIHKDQLGASLGGADLVMIYASADLQWNAAAVARELGEKATVYESTDDIIASLLSVANPGDHIVIMSNGGFENLHQRLMYELESSQQVAES